MNSLSANLLRLETSPYLLQHKDNPVHWMAWGDEAFAKARAVRGSFSGGGSFSRGGSVMRRRNGSRFIRLAGSRFILSRLAYDWRLRSKREREAFGRVFRHSFR